MKAFLHKFRVVHLLESNCRMTARAIVTIGVTILTLVGGAGCAPRVQDLNLASEVIEELPKDVALGFLQSLRVSLRERHYCRFDGDGVARWVADPGQLFEPVQRGQNLPGKYPYETFLAAPETPGYMVIVSMYQRNIPNKYRIREPWCVIAAESNADREGKDVKRFTAKILTALLSLGVHVPNYRKSSATGSVIEKRESSSTAKPEPHIQGQFKIEVHLD